ncbi:hypothetical protein NLJ89_g4713 [Agrocybe chaxingu]|uniref:Uncharacterized protein n=1 Tax=Agrocybe chaxingu TaxID=84603 RepID=A0A9W8K2D5_9AGAR|nr:hypothetical protein NLJ89_g4713 [Agrocybe chaxingu]
MTQFSPEDLVIQQSCSGGPGVLGMGRALPTKTIKYPLLPESSWARKRQKEGTLDAFEIPEDGMTFCEKWQAMRLKARADVAMMAVKEIIGEGINHGCLSEFTLKLEIHLGEDLGPVIKDEKWLEFFKKAMDGDQHCQAVMMRYSRLIAAKRAKADLRRVMKGELERQLRARTQPIWTGGFLRPTLFHGPLPRMYPQPKPIAMIVRKRILSREKRFKTRAVLEGDLEDLKLEGKFEEGLRDLTKTEFPTFFSGEEASAEWRQPIQTMLDEFKLKDQREYARAAQPFPPELVEAIFEARREKIRNKTREKERERRGERTLSGLRRKRQGPPAHILSQMTPAQREMDKVSRSLSEVGYVALVKRRLGRKLKDPEAGLELGEVQNRPLLDKTREIVREENKRRRLEEMKDLKPGTRRKKSG